MPIRWSNTPTNLPKPVAPVKQRQISHHNTKSSPADREQVRAYLSDGRTVDYILHRMPYLERKTIWSLQWEFRNKQKRQAFIKPPEPTQKDKVRLYLASGCKLATIQKRMPGVGREALSDICRIVLQEQQGQSSAVAGPVAVNLTARSASK